MTPANPSDDSMGLEAYEWEDAEEHYDRLLLKLQYGETNSPSHEEARTLFKAILTNQLKALMGEAIPNPTTPAGDNEFVPISAIQQAINKLEKL